MACVSKRISLGVTARSDVPGLLESIGDARYASDNMPVCDTLSALVARDKDGVDLAFARSAYASR
jgi:hypothetical protein